MPFPIITTRQHGDLLNFDFQKVLTAVISCFVLHL